MHLPSDRGTALGFGEEGDFCKIWSSGGDEGHDDVSITVGDLLFIACRAVQDDHAKDAR